VKLCNQSSVTLREIESTPRTREAPALRQKGPLCTRKTCLTYVVARDYQSLSRYSSLAWNRVPASPRYAKPWSSAPTAARCVPR
jgi:hypothetical protein